MTNYFMLFELPLSLKVDKQAVMNKYYELSKKYHPDHNAQLLSVAEQKDLLAMSATINQAKNILLDQDKTIAYMLQLHHKLVEGESLDTNFLMEMLDLNERLEDAKSSNNETALDAIRLELDVLQDELTKEINSIVEAFDVQANKDSVLNELKAYYLKKKYLLRIRESL